MAGLFITFEGIDGSGKSTQARLLAERLQTEGVDALHTREPGGSPGAEEIRRLVLEGDPSRWSPITEILLFTAARRDHLERVIDPALESGRVVVCDRFADSTRMYQGLRAGLGEMVEALHVITIGREPDLTFIIDMDPKKGHARAKGRNGTEERFEDFGTDLQVLMRKGFLELAAAHPERCVVIDGDRPVDAVAQDVMRVAKARLP